MLFTIRPLTSLQFNIPKILPRMRAPALYLIGVLPTPTQGIIDSHGRMMTPVEWKSFFPKKNICSTVSLMPFRPQRRNKRHLGN